MELKSVRARVLGLLGWLALTFVAAAVGAAATLDAPGFYAQLVRPAWAPPAWLFGPVWSVLYTLIGVAVWRVWCLRLPGQGGGALPLYVVQLGANALWSWLFFAWHQGGLAFADILLLWALIAATALSFWRVSRLAGLLLLPYLGWVSFAAVLNWVLWRANPGLI